MMRATALVMLALVAPGVSGRPSAQLAESCTGCVRAGQNCHNANWAEPCHLGGGAAACVEAGNSWCPTVLAEFGPTPAPPPPTPVPPTPAPTPIPTSAGVCPSGVELGAWGTCTDAALHGCCAPGLYCCGDEYYAQCTPEEACPHAGRRLGGGPQGTVIFRLDDVQDWWPGTASRDMVQTFLDAGERLSIGVIGGIYFGTDARVVDKVHEAVAKGSEVFNHGPDASTLFNEISTDEARETIARGELDAFKPYTSFVPHENRWAASTVEALSQLGYTVFSPSTTGPFAATPSFEGRLKVLPQAAETAKWEGGAWLNRVREIMPRCTDEIARTGVCVVMMHPQDVHYEQVTLEELRWVIGEVKRAGWAIKTFRDIGSPSCDAPAPAREWETCTAAHQCCEGELYCCGDAHYAQCESAESCPVDRRLGGGPQQ
eukprot:TRINITY_DN165_c4_g1_i1.p1 TRINITY_DN165_c4_g1~~TRINITY_DN165_c4_g1_i1.p1  ORF type:complete len:430 (+),score=188.59 TRINITY_DN165_c4_g1_i1:82-1371(+)